MRLRLPLIAITAVLLLAPAAGSAATTWELALMGGINVSKLTGDDTGASLFAVDGGQAVQISGDIGDTSVGFLGGVAVTAMFNEKFGFQTGALISRKGGDGNVSIEVSDGGGGFTFINADIAINLDYIEIPALAVIALPAGETTVFRIVAGPTFAFNLNADLEVSAFGESASEDFSDEVTGVDIGGTVGAGVSIPFDRVSMMLDGRWTFGFNSIDDSGVSPEADIKNSAFAFTVGIGVPLDSSQ